MDDVGGGWGMMMECEGGWRSVKAGVIIRWRKVAEDGGRWGKMEEGGGSWTKVAEGRGIQEGKRGG